MNIFFMVLTVVPVQFGIAGYLKASGVEHGCGYWWAGIIIGGMCFLTGIDSIIKRAH